MQQQQLKVKRSITKKKKSAYKKQSEIPTDVLRELFSYSEESASGLIWNVERFSGNRSKRRMTTVGSPAGGVKANRNGYWTVGVEGGCFVAHIIVYELHYGKIPIGMFIDHIDGDRKNNLISNLRVVDRKTNSRNRKMSSANKTGVVGVSHRQTKTKGGFTYYLAKWKTLEGKSKTKSFCIETLGQEEAFAQATKYRLERMAELIEAGEGYTERHLRGY